MNLPKLLLALALLFIVPASRASLEFTGYISVNGIVHFVLTDLTSGDKSAWLLVGGTFQGHKVVSYEREYETLILERGATIVRLPLKDARVRDGSTGLSHARARLFIVAVSTEEKESFVAQVLEPDFRTHALRLDLTLIGQVTNATLRLIPKSSVVEVTVVAQSPEASLTAAELLCRAVVAGGISSGSSGIRVTLVQRPTLLK